MPARKFSEKDDTETVTCCGTMNGGGNGKKFPGIKGGTFPGGGAC